MYRSVRLIASPLLAAAGLVATGGCSEASPDAETPAARRLLVLGIDGMDPGLLKQLMESGRMPNFSRIAAAGGVGPLATSAPPQSPVAWSNFISGAGPGTHQIYDFIHRRLNPDVLGLPAVPFLSTSQVQPPDKDWALAMGEWRIPLFGPKTESLRRGGAFWEDLIDHGVKTVIYRVPANYPAPQIDGGTFACLCGMGTPDLVGTYGEFTFFTPEAPRLGRMVAGGRFDRLRMHDNRGIGTLKGPPNFLHKPTGRGMPPDLQLEVEVVRDPTADVAKIAIGDEIILLNQGEWSDWIPVEFETGIPASWALSAMALPTSANGMVRFYLKSVHPDLQLYVTPLNVDPLEPVTPISAPEDFSKEVALACGRYYTTGIPEDTKALRAGALTEDEFLSQVRVLTDERLAQFRYALQRFDRGFLFFYFGHTDQLAHIFWRDRDPGHPAHNPQDAERYGTVIDDAYMEMDQLLGEAISVLGDDDDTIIVMSDHGFASFRRGFNLNTWLLENGYMALRNPALREQSLYLSGVDWHRTRAYALGLNGLYVNLAGRESRGIVQGGPERTALIKELKERLLAVRDTDGVRVIETVYIVGEYYPDADPDVAPDILVGYADNYRASWATAEGSMPQELLEDNHDRWSGDHCIAHTIVPGILLTNRKVVVDNPDLTDLAPTILSVFGIDAPAQMTGRVLFAEPGPS